MSAATGPTRFVVRDAAGDVVDPVVPETLRPYLVQRAGDPASVVELTEIDPSTTAAARSLRTTPTTAGAWVVETDHDGDRLVATAPNTDAAFDLLRSWAAEDGWWLEAFGWRSPGASSES